MLNTLRHLLPDSTAWRLVVERTLKKYLRGIATVGSDAVAFIDDVYDDLWPDLTRELQEWQDQFNIVTWPWSQEVDMRAYLDFRWGEERGQSPKHLQDKLQAAGFDAYVYDSFDWADLELRSGTGDIGGVQDTTPTLTEITTPTGFHISMAGTRLYVIDDVDNEIHQYTLSSPYKLSTASYDNKLFDVTTWANPTDVYVRDDGKKMYVLNQVADTIVEFDLSTSYDVSTAVFLQNGTDFTTQEAIPRAMHFALDGTRVFITGHNGDQVHRFDMSTAWDVSTMSHVNSYNPSITDPNSVTFTPNGKVMLIADANGDTDQFNLATAWDITTASTTTKADKLTDPAVQQKLIAGLRFNLIGPPSAVRINSYMFGAWRNPTDYGATQPLLGNTQCGDDGSGANPVAECGEQPPNQKSEDSAVCNRFLANDVFYLVNNTVRTDEAPPPIPTDSRRWGPIWYVGGSTIDTKLELDEYDRARFEEVCLKHGPADQYIVTMVERWQTNLISNWDYELAGNSLDSGEWQFTNGTVSPVKIHDTDADGTDQSAVLATIASGDKLRFVRADDGSWIDYLTTGAASDQTTYWSVAINTTPTATSSDWAGFPGSGGNMQIYHRESV